MWDGLMILGMLAVIVLMGVIRFCKAAARADEDAAHAKRFMLQMEAFHTTDRAYLGRAFNWPERRES